MASFLQMSSNSLPDNVATWTVGSNDPTTGLILSYKEKKKPNTHALACLIFWGSRP